MVQCKKNNYYYNPELQPTWTFGYKFTCRDKFNPKYEVQFSPPEETENSWHADYLPTLAIDFWGKCVKLY